MRNQKFVLMLLLGFEGGGCGTWSGNPKNPGTPTPPAPSAQPPQGQGLVSLSFRGDAAATGLLGTSFPVKGRGGKAAGTIVISSARVVLKEIKLKSRGDDAAQREEFKGPFVVDLVTNTVAPDPGTINLAAGSYAQIELKLDKSDVLEGNSVGVEGVYTDAEGRISPFKLSHDVGETFSIAPTAPLSVAEGVANPVVIAFQLATWFDLSTAENDLSDVQGDLTFTKDSSSQPAKKIRDAVKDNLKRSANPRREDKQAKLPPASAPTEAN